jgi:hypothetical protein
MLKVRNGGATVVSVGVTRVPDDLGPGLGSRNRVGDPRPITRDWQRGVSSEHDDLAGFSQ